MLPFFDYHHIVSADEIDAQQHVHNLRYLQWTLWAAGAHTRAAGWDSQSAREQQLDWVVRSHQVTYRAAAKAGDEIIVRTWVSDLERFASRRKYLVCRPADRTLLTRVETRWVYVDLSQHKVVPIPPDVRAMITVAPQVPSLPWE
jgi:acyl-CoA thioester hydrolase